MAERTKRADSGARSPRVATQAAEEDKKVSDHNRFDPTSPCLVIAPHLEYPVRTGADILIDKKYGRFSRHVPFVDLVGKNVVVRYRDGEVVRRRAFDNAEVSKARAALRTLRKRSHYLLEKFVTREFLKVAGPYLADPEYKTVVLSFVYSAAIVEDLPPTTERMYCIETHNDEIAWYENLRKSSANPLAKLASYSSERWALSFVRRHVSDFLFLHVSEGDRGGFARRFPEHVGYVVPTGVDEMPNPDVRREGPTEKARLIFVGSLGVKINLDALEVFKKTFYPVLRAQLGRDLEVLVVGSNPSKTVRRLCENSGWKLRPNVSERELTELYGASTFSVLPFTYTTGSKLKLLDSLARGVPFLATESLSDQVNEVAYPCLISNDPEEWAQRVRDVRVRGIADDTRVMLKGQAQAFSWDTVAHRTFEAMKWGGKCE